jgi:hypothetical protein
MLDNLKTSLSVRRATSGVFHRCSRVKVEIYALAREAERAIIAKLSNAGHILRNVLDRKEGNVGGT